MALSVARHPSDIVMLSLMKLDDAGVYAHLQTAALGL
jgi:hypothetical protein